MGRLNYLLLISILLSKLSFSQQTDFDNFPAEHIELSTNSQVYTSGEDLFVNIYCFNADNNKISTLSSIVYILIINDEDNTIYQEKTKLENGFSSFKYYIPSYLDSGNYKIVAYTKWMLSKKNNYFTFKDIYIINPFIKKEYSKKYPIAKITKEKEHKTYKIIKQVGQRKKVEITLSELDDLNDIEIKSILIMKKDNLKIESDTLTSFLKNTTPIRTIPEVRGELITGTILDKNKQAVAGVSVSLSMTNNANIYKTSETNSEGKYFFNLYENYNTGNVLIKLQEQQNLTIIPDVVEINVKGLQYHCISIDKSLEKWLEKKSFYNQIETSYFDVKKASPLSRKEVSVFFGKAGKNYLLSDYKSFGTIKETFVEIINEAHIKHGRIFVPIEKVNDTNYKNLMPLLVLIDGIPINDHKYLIELDIQKVKSINVINSIYQIGASLYKGVISVETRKGNSDYVVYKNTNQLKECYQKKQIFSPDYSKENIKHIPDYRTVLYWQTNIVGSNFVFYTSDITGIFEIKIEGLKEYKIINKSILFEVN